MNNKLSQLFIVALFSTLFVAKSWAEVVVIVNPSVSASVSTKDISRIFLGKSKSLPGGHKVKPLSLSEGNAARDEFNEKVLKKSSSQLKSYWSKLIFTGKGQPPKELGSDADMIAKVSSDAGSIGYISKESVTDAVKVLASF
jgi:ABC-type phosphate transport system substrate-binding protein